MYTMVSVVIKLATWRVSAFAPDSLSVGCCNAGRNLPLLLADPARSADLVFFRISPASSINLPNPISKTPPVMREIYEEHGWSVEEKGEG